MSGFRVQQQLLGLLRRREEALAKAGRYDAIALADAFSRMTNGDTIEPLTTDEIDQLYERIGGSSNTNAPGESEE